MCKHRADGNELKVGKPHPLKSGCFFKTELLSFICPFIKSFHKKIHKVLYTNVNLRKRRGGGSFFWWRCFYYLSVPTWTADPQEHLQVWQVFLSNQTKRMMHLGGGGNFSWTLSYFKHEEKSHTNSSILFILEDTFIYPKSWTITALSRVSPLQKHKWQNFLLSHSS